MAGVQHPRQIPRGRKSCGDMAWRHTGAWFFLVALVCALMTLISTAARAELDLKGHGGPVRSITIAPSGAAALSSSFDYSVIHWDLANGAPKLRARLEGHDAAVNDAEFMPGGKLALSGSDDGTLGLWDLATGKLIHRFKGHKAKVVSIAVSPDGRRAASAGWDGMVRIWDLKAKRGLATLKGHAGNVNSVIFSNDGQMVFSAGYDGTIKQWRMRDMMLERTLHKHGWGVNVLANLPQNGRILFGALDGTVEILDTQSGEVSKRLAKHEGPVLSLAVSDRHGLVASGGGDGKIFVFSLKDWSFIKKHQNPSSPVWSMALTGDGQSIYYAGLDDFVIHWEVRPGKPFEPVKSKYPRRFQVKQDAAPGQRHFDRKCSICHTLTPTGGNRAGPTLYKLFGRRAGTVRGYVYSNALKGADIVWNEVTIGRLFNEGPDHFTPGSKMPLQRIKSARERNALIAYLKRATAGD